jgi:hypothetical protein
MNTEDKDNIVVISNSSAWWNSLDGFERDEYFNMYYRDMERMDLLRVCSVDELDSCDIEQIYNDYYC